MKKRFFAVALATTMVLSSAMTASAKTITGGWWTAWTESYELTDTLEFDIEVKGGDANFNNVNAIFANAAVTGENAPAAEVGKSYKEYAVFRADSFGWGGGDNKSCDGKAIEYSSDIVDANGNGDTWDDFRAVMKDAHIDATITKTATGFELKYAVAGANGVSFNYTAKTEADTSAGLHVFFGCDNSEVTVTKVETVEEEPETEVTEPETEATAPSNPSADTKNPSVDTDNPSVDTKNPSVDTDNPSVDTKNPSVDTDNPSVDTNKPSVDGGSNTDKNEEESTSATTGSDSDVVTGVTAEGLKAGQTLVARKLTADSVSDAVKKFVAEQLKGLKVAYLDLSILEGGVEVQPDGTIKVTVPVSLLEGFENAKVIKVFHEHGNEPIKEIAKCDVVDGKITFSTDKFSTFIFADWTGVEDETETTVPPTGGKPVPTTGDAAPIAVLAAIATLAGAGVVVSRKKRA